MWPASAFGVSDAALGLCKSSRILTCILYVMAKLTDDGETQVCSALVVVICIIKIFFKGQITQTFEFTK